jgi:hypothetical protein
MRIGMTASKVQASGTSYRRRAISIVALGAVALVAVAQPTGWTVIVIAVLVLVALVVIELMGRPVRMVVSPKAGYSAHRDSEILDCVSDECLGQEHDQLDRDDR